MAVGGISLWQLAELSVLLIITESNMTMIIKDDAKIQNYDKKEEYFSGNQEYFSRNQKLYSTFQHITNPLHSHLSR